MKRCSIVTGSFWGDEGKGHMTDILCEPESSLDVRFNGGSQASHTVQTPDGKRHAFRHFGAGTFAGAKTYLSKFFIVNTVAFALERKELVDSFGITPCVYVNPDCIVTTFWDMYINQGVEVLRADKRHGSCGFGINETVERSNIPKYKITVMDLLCKDRLKSKLIAIQNEYVPARLRIEYNLKIKDLPMKYQELLTDSKNMDMFMFYADEFISNVQIHGDGILNRFDNVVFEGAQGLLLDQNNSAYFPHVTTSNTGIKNVMEILHGHGINFDGKVNIYYMSRCYITRHGAGPFKNELKSMPYSKIVDLTNIPNEFQGSLRFGYLDFDLLIAEIKKDLKNLTVDANVNITFTCLDQLDEDVKYWHNLKLNSKKSNKFLKAAWEILSAAKIRGFCNIYGTNGPTRDCITSYKQNGSLF